MPDTHSKRVDCSDIKAQKLFQKDMSLLAPAAVLLACPGALS